MPGSALRRMVCEKGSIKNHFASFKYRPLKDIFSVSRTVLQMCMAKDIDISVSVIVCLEGDV